jgi:hypothetical protein
MGSTVSIKLTFAEAAEIQRDLDINCWGVPKAVLARVLRAFLTNPTSQRQVQGS